MNTILPILIVLSLGAASALLLHRLQFPLWVVSVGGALIATAIWTGGILALFAITAPSELTGGILWVQELKILLTGWISASVVALILKEKTSRKESPTGTVG